MEVAAIFWIVWIHCSGIFLGSWFIIEVIRHYRNSNKESNEINMKLRKMVKLQESQIIGLESMVSILKGRNERLENFDIMIKDSLKKTDDWH